MFATLTARLPRPLVVAIVGVGYGLGVMAAMTAVVLPAVNPTMLRHLQAGWWVVAHLLFGLCLGLAPVLRSPPLGRGTRNPPAPDFWAGSRSDPFFQHMLRYGIAAGLIIHATSELMRALRARDEVVAIASHDLKVPLAALRLRMEVLARGAEDKRSVTPEQITRVAHLCERQMDRMLVLINNLLDLSRLRAYRFTLNRR